MARVVEAHPLGPAERPTALAHLGRAPQANLFLLDLLERLGSHPAPGEMPTEVVAAWRGGELLGMAGLRPSVVLDAEIPPEALEALVPFLDALHVGLIKSAAPAVDALWDGLQERRRRRSLIDRIETAYAVGPREVPGVAAPPGARVRRAHARDLDALVVAARESLREESRPDPFAGDRRGFREWVAGRVDRARIVERDGDIVFVGYADVQRPEGWLLQGVYTWPRHRGAGLARLGVAHMCREAFAAGADHVQLAVVEGNAPARRLYEGLGFKPFARLRTILFA